MSSMKTSSALPSRPRAGVPHVLTNATLRAILHLPGSNRRSLAHGGVGPRPGGSRSPTGDRMWCRRAPGQARASGCAPLPAQPPHQAEYQTQCDTWKRDPQGQAPMVTDLRFVREKTSARCRPQADHERCDERDQEDDQSYPSFEHVAKPSVVVILEPRPTSPGHIIESVAHGVWATPGVGDAGPPQDHALAVSTGRTRDGSRRRRSTAPRPPSPAGTRRGPSARRPAPGTTPGSVAARPLLRGSSRSSPGRPSAMGSWCRRRTASPEGLGGDASCAPASASPSSGASPPPGPPRPAPRAAYRRPSASPSPPRDSAQGTPEPGRPPTPPSVEKRPALVRRSADAAALLPLHKDPASRATDEAAWRLYAISREQSHHPL